MKRKSRKLSVLIMLYVLVVTFTLSGFQTTSGLAAGVAESPKAADIFVKKVELNNLSMFLQGRDAHKSNMYVCARRGEKEY
ncbi:hypothetical protein RRU94_06180 [Domibacillus sp. DTU_2020_1001157_1_SI_ALB_TIR_016]|uniref:hypothetical protein n=1 Tax=Domibacillus sp. DTU_2020_1001157_1_SI_ALB_TIR_016 TaxID=3077789 RepID=UPI0028E4DAF3|nr:hypothetical protein [Domibacillus sp. DTU_2020_1001157_1_SI_ALB_TIR_016]WNS78054.1 hypothetical protein RRU94_06180 [Domibacillus sp. DTU_2020_1001157_1_SI_ALB_TIR_016]